MTLSEAQLTAQQIFRIFHLLTPSRLVLTGALEFHHEHKVPWFDSLMAATAIEAQSTNVHGTFPRMGGGLGS